MDKELVAHIVELVKKELAISADAGAASSAIGMLRLELVVHQCLMEIGRQAVQGLVQEAGTGYQGRRVERGKVVYRFKGNRPKTVHGLYGPVTVERAYYYATGSGETWVPLDEQLGIGDGQTPACEYHLAQFVGQMPYQRSLSHFHTVFRPAGLNKISLHKAECMVDALGERLEAQRQQEIEKLFEHHGSVAVANKITGTMVVCIDAGKLATKGNERVDDEERRRYDREFRAVKVPSISELKWDEVRQEARCTKTSYVLGIEHADQFFQRIWVEMNRRSADLTKLRLVFIGDGAEWIWNRVAEIDNADNGVYILDFCHAVDHLAKVCKLLYGQGTAQFDKHLQQWRARLREGGTVVIDDLEQLRDSHREHGDEIQAEINYLEGNRERMNYRQYREDHVPIGSGTVESACKNVVAARMKGSGMTWTLEAAQHMLQLRASIMSERFARDHQNSLPGPPQPAELLAAA